MDLSDFCERIADCFFGLAGEAIDVFRCGEPHRKSEMPFYAHVLRTITQALPRAGLKVGRSHLKIVGIRRIRQGAKMKKTPGMIGTVVASIAIAIVSTPSQALELKVADSFPAGHYLVRLMAKMAR